MSDPVNDQKIPTYEESNSDKGTCHWLKVYGFMLIKLVISIIAAYFSWQCTGKDSMFLRILYVFFAIMFSEIYLIYYIIYRVYMGNKCAV